MAVMSHGEEKAKQWRLRVRDLLYLITGVAAGLAAIRYAVTNSVSTYPQSVLLCVGWFTLAGCVGISLWWLWRGTTSGILKGAVLGICLAALPLLLVTFMRLILQLIL
jgi:hypothetical protein